MKSRETRERYGIYVHKGFKGGNKSEIMYEEPTKNLEEITQVRWWMYSFHGFTYRPGLKKRLTVWTNMSKDTL